MRISLTWDEDRVQKLKTLWDEGLSASLIGARLGISRNAVLGKSWRLGLSQRPAGGDNCARERIVSRRKARAMPAQPQPRKVTPKSIRELFPVEDPHPIPPSTYDVARVSFDDLEPYHCKWICTPETVPHDQKSFCGCKRVEGQPYCAEHARRAFSQSSGVSRPDFIGYRSRITGALVKRITNSVNLFEDA